MTRRYRPFDPFERGGPFEAREIQFPRPPRRFWVGAAFFGLAVVILFIASPIVWFFTEMQWYDALGFREVFTTRLSMQVGLVVGSFVLSLVYVAANVIIALRLRAGPSLRAVGIRRSSLRSGIGGAALGASVLIALVLSGGAGTQWQSLALFEHAKATGITDPVLGQDISFYLLTLPFLHSIINWALGLAFLTPLLIGVLYAWRGDTFDLNPTPLAIAHLSALLAVFAVILAAFMWIGRYDLLYQHNTNVVWGAAYTDVMARLPIITFQSGLAVVLAGALLVNVWLRRLWIGVTVAIVWIAFLLIGGIYPWAVQNFFVTPNAQTYELPYIEREITGTQAAYGLSNVTVSKFTGDQPLTLSSVQSDQVTINNLRLWDFAPLIDTYDQQQAIRTYYSFSHIDIDRYTIDNQYTSVEIAAREFNYDKLPDAAKNWVNQHLQYTHGYGVAASPVNAVTTQGLPDYVVTDIPPTGKIPITQPAIYFGVATTTYALAPNTNKEFDYPSSPDAYTSYKGTHGVPMTPANRALWSLKLGDFNLLVSGQVTSQTLMLYRRQIVDRVTEIAPFLTFDSQPYLVIVDGRIYWIVDAYTTASTYPYSQTVQFQNNVDINYIRNSVKVVIDAYEGTAVFYVSAPKDPLIQAYEATFPTLFTPIDAMSATMRAHIRVPVDLFSVQVGIYGTYHLTASAQDAKTFFAREDVWDLPTYQPAPGSVSTPVSPYYVLFRLPGEQNPEYLLIMPFTPHLKNNLVSWMAVRNDGTHYGEYVSYVLPKDKVIFGPQNVANLINQDPAISRDFTLFHGTGSQVEQGNLLVVPIGDSFLYFEPIYLKATSGSSIPELKKVILADQDTVVYADTLQQAIDQLVGTSSPSPPTNTGPPTTLTTAQVAEIASLVTQANTHYQAAYTDLKNGDFAGFQTEMAEVGKLLQQLQTLTGTTSTGGGATPSPSPSPRASPSASQSP
jgi:uncharacterized membrane protein (UPF0182 family)